jgi:hypothetical protein
MAAVARAWAGGRELADPWGRRLTVWEGMSYGWVEEHVLRPEREVGDELEDLFGNGGPEVHVGTGSAKTVTTAALLDEWENASLTQAALAISAPNPVGRWEWEHVTIETSSSPNPIRRILISLLLGAKWTPNSPKSATESYGSLTSIRNPPTSS